MKTEKRVAVFDGVHVSANIKTRSFSSECVKFLGTFDRTGEPIVPKEYRDIWKQCENQIISTAKIVLDTHYSYENEVWETTTELVELD